MSSTFNRYSRVASRRGFTGAQAAEEVLRAHGVYNVRIERVSGRLSDHYDPRSNVIRLSDAVYGSTSIASLGVAAHEAGHAVQYAVGYGPIKLRTAIIPVCNIGSQLSLVLIILGLVLYFPALFGVGVILFALAVVGQIVTLPVEFNASRRAIQSLSGTGLLDDQELRGAPEGAHRRGPDLCGRPAGVPGPAAALSAGLRRPSEGLIWVRLGVWRWTPWWPVKSRGPGRSAI